MATSSPKPSYLVFISHSAKDSWIARQIASKIEHKGRRFGVTTFLDEKDIEGGEPIPDTIRMRLQECDEFLVLLTQNSIGRPWVLAEMGGAWALEKHIVAILSNITPQEMPSIISQSKAIDLNNFEEYLAQLTRRAKGAKP